MTKGYKMPESEREKRRETMKRIGGNSGTWKKGQKAWNFKGGKRLKRKYKRFNGKLMHNACVVWLKYNSLKEVPKGFVIHHKDRDSLNDNIENLILMKDSEHKYLHNQIAGEELTHNQPGQDVGEISQSPIKSDKLMNPGANNHEDKPLKDICVNCGGTKEKYYGLPYCKCKKPLKKAPLTIADTFPLKKDNHTGINPLAHKPSSTRVDTLKKENEK